VGYLAIKSLGLRSSDSSNRVGKKRRGEVGELSGPIIQQVRRCIRKVRVPSRGGASSEVKLRGGGKEERNVFKGHVERPKKL